MTPPILHKVRHISDEACINCSQCWKGECRAYCVPHSEEERKYRNKDKYTKCGIPINPRE